MPVYDYKCSKCGKVFEYKQSINDEPLKKCPESVCECSEKGQGNVSRVFSKNIGLVFKGSGFYLTDYANKNGNSISNGESKKSDAKKTDTKKEAKPESKKEIKKAS